MSVIVESARVVHFPENPAKFVFDKEVAEIFPDMALRSIPLFYETHALHANLAGPWLVDRGEPVDILDVGTSRGTFIEALKCKYDILRPGLKISACDISAEMVGKVQHDYPYVDVFQADITSDAFIAKYRKESFDVINCTYVIQFVNPDKQVQVLRHLVSLLKPGGVLFLGQKIETTGPAGRLLHKAYIDWRLANGYTREEIDAKTAALKNSMWPMTEESLVGYLNRFSLGVTETTRWGVFNNYMCTKGL